LSPRKGRTAGSFGPEAREFLEKNLTTQQYESLDIETVSRRKPTKTIEKNEEVSYLIGMLLGDGCIPSNLKDGRVYIHLNKTQPQITDQVVSLFEKHTGVKLKFQEQKENGLAVICGSVTIRDRLLHLGLVAGHKGRNSVEIPNWILENNKFSLACVDGLIDSDGCCCTSKNVSIIDFTNFSEGLIKTYKQALDNLKIIYWCDDKHVKIQRKSEVKKFIEMSKFSVKVKFHFHTTNKVSCKLMSDYYKK
jgi:intein/homing endonuclease